MAMRQIKGLLSQLGRILRARDYDAKSKIARACLKDFQDALEFESVQALTAELRRLKDWQTRFERARVLSPDRRHIWAKLSARYKAKHKKLSKQLPFMLEKRARGRQRRLSL